MKLGRAKKNNRKILPYQNRHQTKNKNRKIINQKINN